MCHIYYVFFFFSSRRRHTRYWRDWSSDVCSSDLLAASDVFVGKAGPSSVYEALAVGRPVLASGYAGLNELGVVRFIEDGGLGRYVRTPKMLLEEVQRYASDPALLEEVARRCSELDLASSTERFAHHIVRYALTGA